MGKKRRDASANFDSATIHSPEEAVALAKSMATAAFDETVEAVFLLGIDPRQAEQAVRGTVSLPNGTGKNVKVAVFAEGEQAKEAEEAGADLIGGAELAAAITEGTQALDWDVTIAMPSLMSEVGKVGRVLGPRGLMPNPKAGTVTMDIGKTVTEFKAGRVEYRNDRYGNVHVAVGKVSFDEQALVVNLASVVDELTRVRPASTKGRYIEKLTLSSTMGPGLKVDVNALEDLREILH